MPNLKPVLTKGNVKSIYYDGRFVGIVFLFLAGTVWKCFDVVTGDVFYGYTEEDAVKKLIYSIDPDPITAL